MSRSSSNLKLPSRQRKAIVVVAAILACVGFMYCGPRTLAAESTESACGCAWGAECGRNCCCANKQTRGLPARPIPVTTKADAPSASVPMHRVGSPVSPSIRSCPRNCPAHSATGTSSTSLPVAILVRVPMNSTLPNGDLPESLSTPLEDPLPQPLFRPPRG